MNRSLRLLAPLLAAAAVFGAFAPALSAGFVDWDDPWLLVKNDAYKGFGAEQLGWMFTTTFKGPYQPLSWLSYALDHAVWGMDPFGFHLTNLILHAAAAALLVVVARRLLPRVVPALADKPRLIEGFALAAALLWACHPLRVESVAWATERRDVLSGMLLFASLAVWLRHTEEEDATDWARSPPYWGAVVLFTLSLLAKSTALGWCLVLLLLDMVLRRGNTRALLVEKIPFVVVAIPVAVMAAIGQQGVGASLVSAPQPLLDRIVLAGYSTIFYAFRTIAPFDLRAHYMRPNPFEALDPMLAGATFLACMATAAALWGLRRRPGVAAAWWAYLVLLAPVSGLVVIGSHLVAERYSYLSTLPLVLAAVAATAAWVAAAPRRVRIALPVAGAMTIALGVSTFRLTQTWNDTETLFARVLRYEPDNWLGHVKVAAERADAGDPEAARKHYVLAIRNHGPGISQTLSRLALLEFDMGHFADAGRNARRALQRNADDAAAWALLGRLADRDGDLEAAEKALRQAARLDEDQPRQLPRTLTSLAWVLHKKGDRQEAEGAARRAVELEPGNAPAWRIVGLCALKRGDDAAAETALRKAFDLRPDNGVAARNLADLLERTGRGGDATDVLRRAHEAAPEDDQIALRAGRAFERSGDTATAERAYRAVIERSEGNAEAHFRLGWLLQRAGRLEDAEAAYRRSIELDGRTPATLGNLAELLESQGRLDDAAHFAARAAALVPRQPGPHIAFGRIAEKLARPALAEKAYRHVLSFAPGHPEATLRLTHVLVRDPARREEAAGLLEEMVAADGDDLAARLRLAELYALLDRGASAREQATAALALAERSGNTAAVTRARAVLAK